MEFISTSVVSPPISFGTSPHHAVLSAADGNTYSATYCHRTEKDKTMSEAYDLYFKGSVMERLVQVCTEAERRGTAVAIAATNSTTAPLAADGMTFSQLYNAICSVGRGFSELGLRHFDRALLFMPPSDAAPLEWLISCYGLWSHGMHVVVATDAAHVALAMRETGVRVIVTTPAGKATVAAALAALPSSDATVASARVIVVGDTFFDGPNPPKSMAFTDLMALGQRCREEHGDRTMPRPEPEHTALIVYSSHTPNRGIVLCHGNLYAGVTVTTPRLTAFAAANSNAVNPAIRTTVVEPLAHITPFLLATAVLLSGGSVSFGLEGMAAFKPTLVAATTATYAAVMSAECGGAAVLHYCLPHADDSAPPTPSSSKSNSSDNLANHGVAYWYNPMAASGVGLMELHGSGGSNVTLMPGIELRLRHYNGNTHQGEVMLKGPCVSRGYYCPNKEVGELDRSMLEDGQWLPTGDIAEIVTPSGDMRIVGRIRKNTST